MKKITRRSCENINQEKYFCDICFPVMCLMEYISGKTETGTKCQGLSASFNENKIKVETVCQGFQIRILRLDISLSFSIFSVSTGIIWRHSMCVRNFYLIGAESNVCNMSKL